jgi:hypothetical protein
VLAIVSRSQDLRNISRRSKVISEAFTVVSICTRAKKSHTYHGLGRANTRRYPKLEMSFYPLHRMAHGPRVCDGRAALAHSSTGREY